MKTNFKKNTNALIVIESFSATFGFSGVIFGILSLLSSSQEVWGGTEESRDKISLIFTSITVLLDAISTSLAVFAFWFGKKILNAKMMAGMQISWLEKIANRLDLYSFSFGIVGLVFGILSLIFILPFAQTHPGNEIATIISIIFDSLSVLLVIWVVKLMIKVKFNDAQ